MVQCAAYNCYNISGKGVSMFLFPKDVRVRKLWVTNMKREGFKPSSYSKLCEKHFSSDCFSMDPVIARQCGMKLMLKPDAIPTVFDFPVSKTKIKEKTRKSSAILKRSAQQTLLGIPEKRKREEGVLPVTSTSSSTDHQTESDPVGYQDDDLEIERNGAGGGNEGKETFNCFTQTTYNLIERRNVKLQILMKPSTSDRATQVNFVGEQQEEDLEDTWEEEDPQLSSDNESDPDWTESDSDDEESQYKPLHSTPTDPSSELKFLVYQHCLEELFPKRCPDCGRDLQQKIVKMSGTCLFVKIPCRICPFQWEWRSQPLSGTMPWGNLILSGAILFSGSSASRVVNLMKFASIPCFSTRTYISMQNAYLVPAINIVWSYKQGLMFDNIRFEGVPLKLGGDARCCSPGHTAKFGSYSLMNLDTSKIIDIKLVQSNEVRNSYNMELEGLKRSMAVLEAEGIDVSDLVTDRHSQVQAYMKDDRQHINHWFNVWRVAKGIYKKIEAASKKKGHEVLGDWARSISNHIYWCAASSGGGGGGDGELVREKWLSILNHVVDIHDGHGDRFPTCQHGLLEDRLRIRKGFKPHMELERIVTGRMLLTDIKKLSPVGQTSSLESFHKVVCYFAPKSVHYFHAQMEARLFLAALHFNENCCREQAITNNGRPQFSVSYPKSKGGDGVAKQIKVQQTFEYISDLMSEVMHLRDTNSSYSKAISARSRSQTHSQPLPLAQSTPKPSKDYIVSRHTTRFSQ